MMMRKAIKNMKENQNFSNMGLVAETLKDLKERMHLTPEQEHDRTEFIVEQSKRNGKIGDFTIIEVPLELLNIDLSYQRTETFDVVRANKIARDFHKSELDPIHISYRDGKFWIVDGQHRVYGFVLLDRKYITGRMDTMTFAEEVKAFMHQHEDKKLSPFDLYKAGLAIGDPVDTALKDLTEKYDVEVAVTRSHKGSSKLQSITTAKGIIDVDGIDTLEWIFQLIKDVKWEHENGAYSSQILRAMRSVYTRYSKEMDQVYPTLVDYLHGLTPSTLLYAAKNAFPMRYDVSAMFALVITAIDDLRPVKTEETKVVPSVGEDKVFVLKEAQ